MAQIHARRRARAQQKIAESDAGAALITSKPNVRYLSGLASSNVAILLPASGPGVLATDSRYAEAAERVCPDLQIVTERQVEPALAMLAAQLGCGTLGFEAQEMTVERHAALAGLPDGPALMVPLGYLVEDIRMIKDDAEIELLASACAITAKAFAAVLPDVRPDRTERDLAVLLERAMIDLGADGVAFDTIVASGPNGAIPHHSPGDRAFRPGDLITIDCGAQVGGYHADMTRTVALGEPAAWQREIYDLVAAAQLAGIRAAVPGADVDAVDASARDLIAAAGHGDHFGHGLGHGVGLEVHEAPLMGPGRTGKLVDRVPVTVEPGIYLPGKGGVRIEDTLVVRSAATRAGTAQAANEAAGAAEVLTTTTKELLVL
ncbi:MAG TPA: Xaa-Pro peptidase family protein [Streptosporangiaceae bacterium]|nr:Xaa-Pro peptidase family protein [Streptosporangiaceae bacterium]